MTTPDATGMPARSAPELPAPELPAPELPAPELPAPRGAAAALPAPPDSAPRRLARLLHRRPRIRLLGLLAAPLGWLVIAYLGSLFLFMITSLWTVDSFTGNLVTQPSL